MKSSYRPKLLLLVLALVPLTAFSADKVVMAVGGMEKQIYLPAKLAEQLGYFKEQDLDVEMINTRAGVEAENELIAGEVQAVVGFYDHTIDIQSKGKSIISIVQLSRAPGEVELVSSKLAKTIKSPADFKGRTLGITGVGSSTDFLTQALATKGGLKAGDYSTIPVGAGNTFIAAMKQEKIDAGMTTEPTISQMLSTGEAQILIDMRSMESTQAALGGPYPAASLYVSSSWLEKNKAVAQKLANAMVKTLQWMNTHSATEIADKMPKEYFVGNRDLYIKGLADGKSQFTADGRMPANGPETVLKVLSTFSKSVMGKNIDLSKTYTMEFVDSANKTLK
ncbi:MAG: transporter substrate binding protein [Rhodocyclales bacterium]|nr:transporter substrate binding protein [Rhodocyclales bacterium]